MSSLADPHLPQDLCSPRNSAIAPKPMDSQPEIAHPRPEPPTSALGRDSVAMRIIETLVERGVRRYFGIPGGPASPLFEAIRLHPDAELVAVRQESHGAFAAAAYHRYTGQVSAVVVTAGPGITSAVTGIASAHFESAPMVVISGDVAWATHGGLLLQQGGPEGLDIEHLLSPITRARVRVTNGYSAPGQCLSALDAALSPLRPGPALLIVPLDRATERAPRVHLPAASQHNRLAPEPGIVSRVADWLQSAHRPLIVLGGACTREPALLQSLVDAAQLPFVTTPRAKGVVSEDHPCSLRNGGIAASGWSRHYTSLGVDVALVLGTDLDDVSIGPTPYVKRGGRLVHVDVRSEVFNRNLPTALGVRADLRLFCQELREEMRARDVSADRRRALMQASVEMPAHDVPDFSRDERDPIAPHRAIADLQAALPDARVATDIGEHMLFCLHYLRATTPDQFYIQLGLGSMGSGIAGATGIALADPTRPVVCICGDGGLHMSGMEVLTSKKLRLPVVYAVFNDSRYNMVHHGMKHIWGQADTYDTPFVDFAAWAQAMDIPSRVVRRGGEISPDMIEALLRDGGPALLDIRIDPEIRIRAGGRVEALQRMSAPAGATERGHGE